MVQTGPNNHEGGAHEGFSKVWYQETVEDVSILLLYTEQDY